MPTDSESPREGDTLAGRYRIDALIGSGGYGRVYRATDLSSSATVAVKVIHGIDDELRARFAREAGIVEKLESPHTVRLLDHGVSSAGMPFMVLELLRGTSVFELLERERTLSPQVALEITAQLLDSLAEAHAMGIVHRDIKPENVFVTSQLGQRTFAKLLDFGIAQHGSLRKLTMQGQVVGTPSYMAPEQTSGKTVDARTDLYAVGLLLAEMVTGRTVMGSGGPMTIMVAQAKNEPVPLGDDVRRSIVGPVVERAVRKVPAERYQSANDMLVDVRAILADVNATSVGPTRLAEPGVGPTHLAEPSGGSPPTLHGIPAHHTLASVPVPPAGQPAESSGPWPRAQGPAPNIMPPPRAVRRKGGPIGVPLAILGVAVLASVVIIALATRSDRDETRHSDRAPKENDDDDGVPLRSNVRRPRTTDVAEIRRALLGAGYTLSVDAASTNVHTFSPLKLPCAGSIVLMTLQTEDMARNAANMIAASPQNGVAMVKGRIYMNVALVRSGSQGVDAGCTEPVAALLAQ